MPTLLHRCGSEGGKPHHVPYSINMRDGRLKVFIHLKSSPRVGLDSDIRQAELFRGTDSADGIKQQRSRDSLAAFESKRRRLVTGFFNAHDFFVKAQSHPDGTHLILEGFNDFRIDEFQEARTSLHEHDRNSKSS